MNTSNTTSRIFEVIRWIDDRKGRPTELDIACVDRRFRYSRLIGFAEAREVDVNAVPITDFGGILFQHGSLDPSLSTQFWAPAYPEYRWRVSCYPAWIPTSCITESGEILFTESKEIIQSKWVETYNPWLEEHRLYVVLGPGSKDSEILETWRTLTDTLLRQGCHVFDEQKGEMVSLSLSKTKSRGATNATALVVSNASPNASTAPKGKGNNMKVAQKSRVVKPVAPALPLILRAPLTEKVLLSRVNADRKATGEKSLSSLTPDQRLFVFLSRLDERTKKNLSGLAGEFLADCLKRGEHGHAPRTVKAWKISRANAIRAEKKREMSMIEARVSQAENIRKKESLEVALRGLNDDQLAEVELVSSHLGISLLETVSLRGGRKWRVTVASAMNAEFRAWRTAQAKPLFIRAEKDALVEALNAAYEGEMPAVARVERALDNRNGFFLLSLSSLPENREEAIALVAGTVLAPCETLEVEFEGEIIAVPGVHRPRFYETRLSDYNEVGGRVETVTWSARQTSRIYRVLNDIVQGKEVSRETLHDAYAEALQGWMVNTLRKRDTKAPGVYGHLGHWSNTYTFEYPISVDAVRRLTPKVLALAVEQGISGAQAVLDAYTANPVPYALNGAPMGGVCYPSDSPLSGDVRRVRAYHGGGTIVGATLESAKLEGRDFDSDKLARFFSDKPAWLQAVVAQISKNLNGKPQPIKYAHRTIERVDDGAGIWWGSLPLYGHLLEEDMNARLIVAEGKLIGKGVLGIFNTTIELPLIGLVLLCATDAEIEEMMSSLPEENTFYPYARTAYERWQKSGDPTHRLRLLVRLAKTAIFPVKEGLMDSGKVKYRAGALAQAVQTIPTSDLLRMFRNGSIPFDQMEEAGLYVTPIRVASRYAWVTRETEQGTRREFNLTEALKEASPAFWTVTAGASKWANKGDRDRLMEVVDILDNLEALETLESVERPSNTTYRPVSAKGISLEEVARLRRRSRPEDAEAMEEAEYDLGEGGIPLRTLGQIASPGVTVEIINAWRNLKARTTSMTEAIVLRLPKGPKLEAQYQKWRAGEYVACLAVRARDEKGYVIQHSLQHIADVLLTRKSNVWYVRTGLKEKADPGSDVFRMIPTHLLVGGHTGFPFTLGPDVVVDPKKSYVRNQALDIVQMSGLEMLQLIATEAYRKGSGDNKVIGRSRASAQAVNAFIGEMSRFTGGEACRLLSRAVQPILPPQNAHSGELTRHLLLTLENRGVSVLSSNQGATPWFMMKGDGYDTAMVRSIPAGQLAHTGRLSKSASTIQEHWTFLNCRQAPVVWENPIPEDKDTRQWVMGALLWDDIFGAPDDAGDETYYTRKGMDALATDGVTYTEVDAEGYELWQDALATLLEGREDADELWDRTVNKVAFRGQALTRGAYIDVWFVPEVVPGTNLRIAFKTAISAYLNNLCQPLHDTRSQFYVSFDGGLATCKVEETDAQAVEMVINLYSVLKKGAGEIPFLMACSWLAEKEGEPVYLPSLTRNAFYSKERVLKAWNKEEVKPGDISGDFASIIEERLVEAGLPADAKPYLYREIGGKLYRVFNKSGAHARVMAGLTPVRAPRERSEGANANVKHNGPALSPDVRLQIEDGYRFTEAEKAQWEMFRMTEQSLRKPVEVTGFVDDLDADWVDDGAGPVNGKEEAFF